MVPQEPQELKDISVAPWTPPGWYAGMRAKVEERASLEKVEELRRVLDNLAEQLGEYVREMCRTTNVGC